MEMLAFGLEQSNKLSEAERLMNSYSQNLPIFPQKTWKDVAILTLEE